MKRCPNPSCATEQFPDEANFCPACAQRLVPVEPAPAAAAAPTAEEGLLGGRFEVGSQIGGHRTGEVHDATDTSDGSACVVKWVHDGVFPSPLLRQRTERELKQLERVQADTVARVLAHGTYDNRLWVACEKVQGQSLKALVSQGVLPIDRARSILLQIGNALAEAAKVGVIHRDVSPKNVLVGGGDRVKVINFGVPTPLTDRVQGEPEFLSPEQVEGKPVDQRANIYSLGAILYYMVTGQPPFVGDANTVMQAHLSGALVPPSQRGAVPPPVEAVIVKALERTSSRRFMTLRQLLTELERADGSGAADSASSTSPFAAAGKAKSDKAAAKTMMGMYAPGADGKPTDVVVTAGQEQAPPPAAVASFAQPTPPPQAAQPTPPPQAAQPTPPPQAAQPQPQPQAAQPTPQPQPRAAQPTPQAADLPPARVPEAATPSAPSVPPGPTTGPGGKRGKPAAAAESASRAKSKKGQFRETLWFKKGELDAVAAEAAAAAAQKGQDQLAPDRADDLPIEDRYEDDGTLTVQDRQSYSLRTGHTQMMKAVDSSAGAGSGMAEDELVDEMKGGRTWVIVAIVLCALAGAGLAAYFIFS